MRFNYRYKVYEDCLAATEISKLRERNKIFLSLTWGWIGFFSVIAFLAMLFSKNSITSRIPGIIVSLIAMIASGGLCWYMFARYDKVTEKKIKNAIIKYISGNKRFIESDKHIDSLEISSEVISKQCMGCGNVGYTQRCVVRKNGHAIRLPLCDSCIGKMNTKVKTDRYIHLK